MTYIKPYLRIMQDCAYDTNKDCSVSGKIKLLNGTVWGEDFTTYYEYTKIGHIENVDNLKSVLGSGDIKVSIYEGK